MGGISLAKGLILNQPNSSGGGGHVGYITVTEQFAVGSGLIPGGNSFTIAPFHPLAYIVMVYWNGATRSTTQWSRVGNVITFTDGEIFAPDTLIQCTYEMTP